MNKNDSKFFEEFKGRCILCRYATPSTRSKQMNCQNIQARNFGLPSRAGGGRMENPVSKLFGCIYWKNIND